MTEVYKQHYRLTGASFAATEEFHMRRESAISEWVALMKELGAKSFQPDQNGMIYAAAFEGGEVPEGWRQLSRINGDVTCTPHKGRKAGKAVHERLKSAPRVEGYSAAIREISKEVAGAIQIKNGNTLMKTVGQRLYMPSVNFVASVPRAIGDELQIPSDWEEISEAEYALFFHEHNAEAAKNRAKETALDALTQKETTRCVGLCR